MSVLGNTALRLDDEHSMLLEVARSFCDKRGGLREARTHLETPLDHDPGLWDELVSMGWSGIGLPEEFGGSGLGIAAAVPVVESMGRALLGTPLMSSLLAAQLLLRADPEGAADVLLRIAQGQAACVAELESSDWNPTRLDTLISAAGRVQGEKHMVMDLQSARLVVVVAHRDTSPVLAVLDSAALPTDAISPCVLIDNTRRAADLRLSDVEPLLLIEGDGIDAALRDYRLLGALLVAAESTGAAAACLDSTVDYLKTRRQFGRLIGSYQALKHPAVDILNAVDAARSFIYHAASILSGEALGAEQEVACRMAKAQAGDTLKYAGDRAVQFHGGMGFTWDCDAQLFLRRAQWAQQQFGDAQHHRRHLATLLLDQTP